MKKTKRTVIAIVMTIVMLITTCMSVYAHTSTWVYSDKYPNYGTRTMTATSNGVISDACINQAGCTYDLMSISEMTTAFTYHDEYYTEEGKLYEHYEQFRTLDEQFGSGYDYGYYPENLRKNIIDVSSGPSAMPVNPGEELMHSCSISYATFTNYVYNPEKDDYIFDTKYAFSEEIHSMEHMPEYCPICQYYN